MACFVTSGLLSFGEQSMDSFQMFYRIVYQNLKCALRRLVGFI